MRVPFIFCTILVRQKSISGRNEDGVLQSAGVTGCVIFSEAESYLIEVGFMVQLLKVQLLKVQLLQIQLSMVQLFKVQRIQVQLNEKLCVSIGAINALCRFA